MFRLLRWVGVFFFLLLLVVGKLLTSTRQEESTLSFIAYEITGMSQDSVFVLHPETGKEWRVSGITSTSYPTWSPDGKWLSFAMWHNGNMDLVKVNILGNQYHWLTDTPNIGESQSKWSPNGRWLAFSATEWATPGQQIWKLNRVDVNGENLIELFDGEINHFEWSTDSTQIAFISTRETRPRTGIEVHAPQITSLYMMNVDGQSIYRITPDFDQVRSFSWSPNGRWLVFSAIADDTHDLYKIHPDGSALQKLTENTWTEYNPTWSPNGGKIVFGSEYFFHMTNPDGSTEIQLTEQPQAGYYPAFWMPNGRDNRHYWK